jgi:hypothetical protein
VFYRTCSCGSSAGVPASLGMLLFCCYICVILAI